MRRLEDIEAELESLGHQFNVGGERVDDPASGSEFPEVNAPTDLDSWSSAVVAAVMKVVWSDPIDDGDDQVRRSSRARQLRALATPIEFESPPQPRPDPETAGPPSWAWAARRPEAEVS